MTDEYNEYESVNNSRSNSAKRKSSRGIFFKAILGIMLVMSVLMNLILLIALFTAIAVFSAPTEDGYIEKIVHREKSPNKIAIINIEGIINGKNAKKVIKQIKSAKDDKNVKALIIKTVTPGGGISASDQIHNEIIKFKKETSIPVVAFMQTIATSGGYYTSAACDKIISEPTTITGSIGVVMGHMVFQKLFEEKLGITPVTFKSGKRKNWPTAFEPITEEQTQYLNDKLIMPAYERFVNIVAEGRKNLSIEQIRVLADGSIYNADEALSNGLIDEIGYIDDAIKLAKELAGIQSAKVVEYTEPFNLDMLLGAQNIFKFDADSIYEMTTPKLMYIWDEGLHF